VMVAYFNKIPILKQEEVNSDERNKQELQVLFKIPSDYLALDIGSKTIELFVKSIKKANTIFWNGPMGMFELEDFAQGTRAIAKALAESKASVVVGGGDSIAALKKMDLKDKIGYISTGGGASLEFLEGKELPGVAALSDKS